MSASSGTPYPPATRSANKRIIKHLYATIRFTNDKIEYLFKTKGLRSPIAIPNAHENLCIFSYVKENMFPQGLAEVLERLTLYLKYYHTRHTMFEGILQNFMEDTFMTF